jgi:thiosulfate reductase / polysulfide reductase chain A
VRALYASGVNIAVTYPDTRRTLEALRSLDVFAVAAHTMNPTAAMADFILPKTTALEEEEISFHASGACVTYTAPAASRVGEVRTDIEIASGLLDRLRRRGAVSAELLPWRSQAEMNAYLLAECSLPLDELRRDGFVPVPQEHGRFREGSFRTPSGKVELYSETLARLGLDPLPAYLPVEARGPESRAEYPLILQTGFREKTYHHSRFREQPWARKVSPDPLVYVHPETAGSHGLEEGDWILLETPAGRERCRLKVSVTEDTMPDILTTGMGWWEPGSAAAHLGALDINVNAVLGYRGRKDPMSGSVDTRGVPCRFTRAS